MGYHGVVKKLPFFDADFFIENARFPYMKGVFFGKLFGLKNVK